MRAVEHLRSVAAELRLADVRALVALPWTTEFENYATFRPSAAAERKLQTLFDQVIAWACALKALRPQKQQPEAPPVPPQEARHHDVEVKRLGQPRR